MSPEDHLPLNRLLTTLPCVVWATDRELRLLWRYGGAAAKTADIPDGALLPAVLPAGHPGLGAHGAALRGESSNYESNYRGRIYHAHVSPRRDGHGEIVGCLGVALDNTERAVAQRQLTERIRLADFIRTTSLALVRPGPLAAMLQMCAAAMCEHLDAAHAGIWALDDAAGRLVLQASAGLAPPAGLKVGVSECGNDVVTRVAEAQQPFVSNQIVAGMGVPDEQWAIDASLTAFTGMPLVVDGRCVGVITLFARQPLDAALLDALNSVAHSIAGAIQRKHGDAAVAQLAAIVRGSNDSIMSCDLDGRITSCNHGAEQLFGYRSDELIGQSVAILSCKPPEYRDTLMAQLIRDGHIPVKETVFRRKDGSLVDVAVSISPIRDANGAIVGISGIARNITDRKRLEQQFQQAQKMEAIGRLAGGVAHDFNNLLTIINGYSEMLSSLLVDDAPRLDMVREVQRAGRRAADLTRQLLAYSRKQLLHPRVLDLGDVVNDARAMLQRLIGEDIQLSVCVSHGRHLVNADPGQLTQVILNLCINARDAMPTGGELTISAANFPAPQCLVPGTEVVNGDYVVLGVTDTGHGMDAETLSHIFEPFFTTKPAGEGTGLGLATVYGIVKQSGGYITAESEPGRGATFRVFLPAAVAETDDARQDLAQPEHGTGTVLLVEDEAAVRALTRRLLERAGYTVLVAENGPEGLDIATRHTQPIALLLTDVVMPHMSGRELAGRLRLSHPETRLLFMSGYTDDAVVRYGIDGVTVPVLQKPFTAAELTARVRQVLDSAIA